MVAVPSTMLDLGTPAPPFALPDPQGEVVRLADLTGDALVIAFICNHCPYVKHLADRLATLAAELQDAGATVVAINANDTDAYPDDGPEPMAAEVRARGYTFPYLLDHTQDVAKAYRAACTPDFYVFDADRRLAYRGQFDDSRPSGGGPPTGADLERAVRAVLAGEPVPEPQHPSIGCNIKWRPGNEPPWFG